MTAPILTPGPIPPTLDLRNMLRQHLIARGLSAMQAAAERRQAALRSGDIAAYQQTIRSAVRAFYGELPVGAGATPVVVTPVSSFEKHGYRIENVLFDSYPGWQVNATVYVPLDYAPPFAAVIVPVGHSGKQFASYQLPAQLFARSGYLAILFDPPGQASERQAGNDHFHDGVRCYLVGDTSSQYFVADALRCLDYLETRKDVDMSRGVAMTGVSGGGTTTTLAMLLDDRITVTGPSCCLSPLSRLDISDCYAGCPETHMAGRYTQGIDEVDLLCAAAPLPTLLMAGETDEVFQIEDTRRLAGEVRQFYDQAGLSAAFEFFVDQGGHAYSLIQARQFVRFMNRWLLNAADRPLPDLPDNAFTLDPYPEIRCYPNPDVNIASLTLDRATALEAGRDQDAARILAAARSLAHVETLPPSPAAVTGEPFQVWTHAWRQVLLQPEDGIELPATFLYPLEGPMPALLHLDDQHRHRLLYRHGPLARAAGLLDREGLKFAVLATDLRGWGDTTPAMYPYEMASWGSLDRYIAYTSAALSDPLMMMRVRDAMAALAYVSTCPEIASDKLFVSGCGLAGIVALHVAAMDNRVKGVVVWNLPASFKALLETESYTWPADAFVPGVLRHYDLPELVAALPCPVQVLNPQDGAGAPLSDAATAALNQSVGKPVYAADSSTQGLMSALTTMVGAAKTTTGLEK